RNSIISNDPYDLNLDISNITTIVRQSLKPQIQHPNSFQIPLFSELRANIMKYKFSNINIDCNNDFNDNDNNNNNNNNNINNNYNYYYDYDFFTYKKKQEHNKFDIANINIWLQYMNKTG